MKLKVFAAALILTPIFLVGSTVAGAEEANLRELYNLCSRFPFNSRCQGLDIPIPLDERLGEEATCVFEFSHAEERNGKCKVAVTDGTLTVYREKGEPIELLDNRRGSMETKIPSSQVFALHYQLWNEVSGGFFNFSVVNTDFSIVDVGFIADSESDEGDRSNLLKIVTSVEFGTSLRDQLAMPTAASAEEVTSAAGLATLVELTESVGDTSENVRQLLETNKCIRCDLRGANLEAADLDGANLEGANLQGANLTEAELDHAYLVGANLSGANLTEADLKDARLILAVLPEANLTDAKMQGANLLSASLQGANLSRATLTAPTVLRNANLENATLTEARLGGADLEGANLERANLEGADLSDFTLELRGSPAGLGGGEFLVTFFLGTDATKNFKFYTNLSSASLRSANLSNADLEDALLTNADLSSANLKDSDLRGVDLTSSNLCGATMSDGSSSSQGCP